MPLVPAALALIAVNFGDRFFLVHLAGLDEVGLYEIGVRIASAMVLLLTAFRTAWPAFAYSIADDAEAKRTYAFVLTYLVVDLLLARARARPALAVARAPAHDRAVLRRLARRRAARVRHGRVRGVHRDGDRRRPREADAAELGDHRRRRRAQRGAEPDPDPALRDDGSGRGDRGRVHADVRAHGRLRAAGLPDAVPVAAGRHRGRCRGDSRRRRQAARRGTRARAPALARLPGRPRARTASTSRPSARDCGGSSRCSGSGRRARSARRSARAGTGSAR